MMRPVTCLSLMVALGAGLYLYQVKHRAQVLDRDINHTVKLAEQARDRIGLMKAEWGLLEESQRLTDLAAHHLSLQALAPGQFVRLEDLASRLPAIAAAPSPPVASIAPEPPAAPETAQPLQRPILVTQAPAAPVHAPPRPAKPSIVVAANRPAEPRPLYAPMLPAYVPTTNAVHAPTIQNASATMASAAPPPPPYVGSALGMARTMPPPPVPLGSASGANLASATSLGYATGR